MEWPRLMAYITGRVDKELLVRNEYLAAENRILRAKIKGWLQVLDGEKRTLAEIALYLPDARITVILLGNIYSSATTPWVMTSLL